MPQFREYHIATQSVKSLCWHDQYLVDWVGGGNIYHLDGRAQPRLVNYAYRFNAAVVSPSGNFAVIYERLGTKGLLLQQGKIVREINRSFYHAHVYEYPVTFIQLADGRELLAHCPNNWCQIDFEDILTGECLTSTMTRNTNGIFYSRLACDPSGRWLLSAGWVWHPWDVVTVYDIQQTLANPTLLDGYGVAPRTSAEVYAAAFADADTLILLTSEEGSDEADDEGDPLWQAGPRLIAYYDLIKQEYRSIVRAEEIVGRLMPIGQNYLVGFYQYPKLFEATTGKVIHRWPELATGTQTSSILWHIDPLPVVAIDVVNQRFAVADANGITVVEIVNE